MSGIPTSGAGDAKLDGGTEASPQTFTEFNQFDNTTIFNRILIEPTTATGLSSILKMKQTAADNNLIEQEQTAVNSYQGNEIYQHGGTVNKIFQKATGTYFNHINQEGSNSLIETEGIIKATSSSSKIGIGTSSPDFPLDIATGELGATNVARTFMNASNTTVGRTSNWSNDPISIRTADSIIAGGYIGVSDVRIKKDIMDLSSTLPLIEQIKPKTYKFINPKRGNTMTYGFIAQELEEVLPCVIKKSRNKIPNVIKIADVSGGVFTLQEATDLIEGDIIAIFDEDDTELRVKISELISDKQFKVETDEELKDKYFIYGKFVDDFQSVEHNCLLPIMMKGIQELNAKNKSLEDRMAILEAKVNNM